MVKNKQFKQLNKIIKSGKSHAGFTLIELLSGLIMSTIVVAGLGFGLYQLTKTTRNEVIKKDTRIESERVREFVADEIRRAQTLEVDTSFANLTNLTDGVAQDYTLPVNTTNGTPRLALQIPGVTQSIIYTVAEPDANAAWEGPLVLYRWGPNMNANGEYNDPDDTTNWDNEPLVDGLDDSEQPVTCNGANDTYQGFFACMEDPDADGLAITAQLYFTSEIDIINGNDSIYTAEAQVVARARDINPIEAEDAETSPLSFRTLSAEYSLGPRGGGASCNDGNGAQSSWFMRTDFINDPNLNINNGYSPKTWIHDPDRQGQPINIDTSHKLTIASIPIGYNNCTGTILSRGNETLDDTSDTHGKAEDGTIWAPLPGVESSDFTIDFSDPRTFNGNKKDYPDYDYHDSNDHPDGEHVKVYKRGSEIPAIAGYDDDTSDGNAGEQSLADFLVEKKYAIEYPSGSGQYRLVTQADYDLDNSLIMLEDNERLITVEIGQAEVGSTLPDSSPNPGFDLQDSLFILSTDKFDQEYTYP